MSQGSTSLNYPIAIDQFLEWEDGIDYGFAFFANDVQTSILNTQNELGINPSGTYDNIIGRMDDHSSEILNIKNNVYGPWEDLGNYLRPRNDKGIDLRGNGTKVLLHLSNSGSQNIFNIENSGSGLALKIIQHVDSNALEFNKLSAGIGNILTLINAGSGTSLTVNQNGDGSALKINKASGTANIIEIVNIGTGFTIIVNGNPIDPLFGGSISDGDNFHTHAAMGTLKSDGTAELTGDWDIGDYKITAKKFESSALPGTAPFIVNSNTLVANLNVDLFDGKDSLEILKEDTSVQLTADWDVGSKQIRAEKFESDIVTGTAPLGVTSTTRVDNLNSQYLGGKEIIDIDYAFLTGNDLGTDITSTELEILSDGPLSIADSLHIHTVASYEIVRSNVLMIRPEENTPSANNKLKLTLGRYFDAGNSIKDKTSSFTTSTFNPISIFGVERYDLVGMDIFNSPVIVQGIEVASPGDPYINAPDIQDDLVPIAIVKIDEDITVIVETSDITDIRPFINPGDVGNIKVNGSKQFSADWNAGSYQIKAKQFESDIPNGTTPFIVGSGTRNVKLNTDRLDGNDITAIDFALLTANDLSTDVTSIELESLTDGSDVGFLHTHTNVAPVGAIALWSGTIVSIPSGWKLCDGTFSTPDLTDKFILSVANSSEDPGATGGSHSIALALGDMVAHIHSGSTNTTGDHGHTGSSSTDGSHGHSGSSGSDGNHRHSAGNQGSAAGGIVIPTTQPAIATTSGGNTGYAGNHSHTVSIVANGNHTHTITVNNAGDHSHTGLTTDSTGSGNSIENRPAFYKLAMVMKI